MSKLHSEIMQELAQRNMTVNEVTFMLVGLNDEIIAEYDFTFNQFKERYEIYIYHWYVRNGVLTVFGSVNEPIVDISEYKVWENTEQIERYNNIRRQILDERIASLNKEFIKF